MTETEPQIVERAAQPSAAVRLRPPTAELDLGSLFARYIPAVAARVGELGVPPAGAPYSRYHSFGGEVTDVEIGFPVAAPPAALSPLEGREPGEVGVSELPAGPVAVAVHRGSYETLGETYRRLEAWIPEQGRSAGGAPWESYVDDPGEVDPSALRTEVCWPLA